MDWKDFIEIMPITKFVYLSKMFKGIYKLYLQTPDNNQYGNYHFASCANCTSVSVKDISYIFTPRHDAND